MKNKHAKQMIVDVLLNNRKLFWFGEPSERFIANSVDEVITLNREWIGDEDVDSIIESGHFGEIALSKDKNYWFSFNCWNDDSGKMEPIVNAIIGNGCYQVSTSYL